MWANVQMRTKDNKQVCFQSHLISNGLRGSPATTQQNQDSIALALSQDLKFL